VLHEKLPFAPLTVSAPLWRPKIYLPFLPTWGHGNNEKIFLCAPSLLSAFVAKKPDA